MTQSDPTAMTGEHERILGAYARLAGAERRPVVSFLAELLAALLLTPIGPGLFLLAFVGATAWNEVRGGVDHPVLLGLGFAVFVTALWRGSRVRGRPDAGREMRGGIKADRASGQVQEDRHEIVDAKVLREPGQGGRILLLRTDADRVFACYDFDSFLGGEPSLAPRALMRVVRFPLSGIEEVLFDGPEVDAGEAVPLVLLERDWPVDATWWDMPWGEIEDWAAGRHLAAA